MSTRRMSSSGGGSKRRTRVDGDEISDSEDNSAADVSEESPSGVDPRCELCGVMCGSGPRLRSKKTGKYRHRACPDKQTVKELLREERRAARATARGEAYVTPVPKSSGKSNEHQMPDRSAADRSAKSVRWVDHDAGDDEEENIPKRSSKDRRKRRDGSTPTRFSEDDDDDENLDDENFATTAPRKRSTSHSMLRRRDKGNNESYSDDESQWMQTSRRKKSKEKSEKYRKEKSPSKRVSKNKHNRDGDVLMDLQNIVWILVERYTDSYTPFYFGLFLVLYMVSRVSTSAAIALFGLVTSLVAVTAGAGERFSFSFEKIFVSIEKTIAFSVEKIKPALEIVGVLLTWLGTGLDNVLIFITGVLSTLVSAALDLKQKIVVFLEGSGEGSDDEADLNAPVSTVPVEVVEEQQAEDVSKTEEVSKDEEASQAQHALEQAENASKAEEALQAEEVLRQAQLALAKAEATAAAEQAAQETKLKEEALEKLKLVKLDLADVNDELVVARRELEAARADAEAARRGRAGAVERATNAAVMSTKADNAEQVEILERLVAETRVEGKAAAHAAASEARRIAADEHARLRERNHELEQKLAESDHLGKARDTLEQASRAKAQELERKLLQTETKHQSELHEKTDAFKKMEVSLIRKHSETVEIVRNTCAAEIEQSRRETVREIETTTRACDAEIAKLLLVKDRVERDWRLASERADSAEEEAKSTLDAAKLAETFLSKSTASNETLKTQMESLQKEKKHLWERLEYAEWRLKKLGLDGNIYTAEELAVAARPGGTKGKRKGSSAGVSRDSIQSNATQDSGDRNSRRSPGPSLEDDVGRESNPNEPGHYSPRMSVKKMAASIEKRSPRRAEAEALMRRVRAMETDEKSFADRVDESL